MVSSGNVVTAKKQGLLYGAVGCNQVARSGGKLDILEQALYISDPPEMILVAQGSFRARTLRLNQVSAKFSVVVFCSSL
ncbi:hypothetical protein HGRIS_008333 [Hohenbuehelia grisea]|uniref:Uncharacterized protein n=1 Tax=Hohenbuehelia grisea TaxID=104357 RepID=A0ABR3J847_9AGAR